VRVQQNLQLVLNGIIRETVSDVL